jgi:hypothetical protein
LPGSFWSVSRPDRDLAGNPAGVIVMAAVGIMDVLAWLVPG